MKIACCARTVLLGLFLISMFVASSFAQDFERLGKGVVKIEAITSGGQRKIGTGFVVRLEQDAVFIVTASHVVEDAEIKVEFSTRRNRLIPARVIGMEGGDPQGLAALLVEENIPSDISVLKLTSSISVDKGDPVITIGFPRVSRVPWAVIKGDIVGQVGKTIVFSGAVDEGNSGGPLMKEGQVIGVVTEVTEQFAYAIPTVIAQYVLRGWVTIEEGLPQPVATPTPRPTTPPRPIPTATPTSQPAPVVGQEWHAPVSGIDFVWVSEGCFRMGCVSGIDCSDDEKPVHEVCLGGFWMGKTEVTQAQWEKVMGNNPSNFKGASRPVEQVSWNDVQKFLQKLNQQAGKEIYRLPTEAEWEYAARAGTDTMFSFGNDIGQLGDYAWYRENSGSETHPVGQLKPNTWGLYDMHGNVWEWCQDWYDSEYYSKSPEKNPEGPSSGEYRVMRGGSWHNNPVTCRSANRYRINPDGRYNHVGFRVVVGSVAWTLQ